MNQPPDSRAVPQPIRLQRPDAAPYARAPRAASWLRDGLLRPIDKFFDWIYGSAWNPLYNSGTMAIGLLILVIVTGVYLLLFYRISSPYESMVAIQSQTYLGRWIRAFHRYASDLAVVFVVFHALRMFVEGRTWGSRMLAWISGLIITAALMICGWTGFVLVWDSHGYALGAAGAKLFDALPLFTSPIGRVFSGTAPVLASFFFLNLFLHMAIPLGMAFLLWIHTSRLARSRWLPAPRIFWLTTVALIVLSVFMAAPLDPQADPLRLGDQVSLDWFYSFWIPLLRWLPPTVFWSLGAGIMAIIFFVPWWWRPRKDLEPPPSELSESICTGCDQCWKDCPFDAITMVPRLDGSGNPLPPIRGSGAHRVAQIDVSKCVSCGICAGSCEQLAIGPPIRTGHAQIKVTKQTESGSESDAIVLAYCHQNDVGPDLVRQFAAEGQAIIPLDVDCLGSLHPLAVSRLSSELRGVFILGCPSRRCLSREGVFLSMERLFNDRDPGDHWEIDKSKMRLVSGTWAERPKIEKAFREFRLEAGERAVGRPILPGRKRTAQQRVVATVVTAALLIGVAYLSRLEAGSDTNESAARLAWRLPGQSYEDCRPLSPEEIEALPLHMLRTEECTTIYLSYRLTAWIDGERVLDELIEPLGARGDRPLYVEAEVPLGPGTHAVRVVFEPREDPSGIGIRLQLEEPVTSIEGRALLITLNDNQTRLIVLD